MMNVSQGGWEGGRALGNREGPLCDERELRRGGGRALGRGHCVMNVSLGGGEGKGTRV